MRETRTTMSDLRQNLDDLVNRAAIGSRIVLLLDSEPKAAIIGIEDLRRLEQLRAEDGDETEHSSRVLAELAELRESVRAWEEENKIVTESIAETLERLREERDAEISGLR